MRRAAAQSRLDPKRQKADLGLMATVIDVCGLTIYFETAKHLLNL